MAEDAATVAPHVYKVLFENERARMLEVSMKPGESTAMHSHPDVLSDGKVRLTSPSGEASEVEFLAGAAMWREAEEHATDNVGTTEVRALSFEPK